jgi:hypothetical protein
MARSAAQARQAGEIAVGERLLRDVAGGWPRSTGSTMSSRTPS